MKRTKIQVDVPPPGRPRPHVGQLLAFVETGLLQDLQGTRLSDMALILAPELAGV